MKIASTRALWGPNYWSIKYHQLIVMLLDLEELEFRPTNTISGFYEGLKKLLPSLHAHQCSEGVPGGFFMRVHDGTWMGHVIEHIALELQTLAGMDVGFGRTRGTGKEGEYHVVFAYQVKEAGLYAAQAAVKLAQALVDGETFDVESVIGHLKNLAEEKKPGPSTASIINEAKKRNIPVTRLDNDAYFQLGYGAAQKKVEASIASTTGLIAVEVVGNKHRTKQILADAFVPVPKGVLISDVSELEQAVADVGYPLVIKPLDGNQGKGATTNICSMSCATYAFERAIAISQKVVVEQFISGRDFRVLVINYKLEAAAQRTPAAVMGDGTHTIAELIEMVNQQPRRGRGHCNHLSQIKVDSDTEEMLERQGLTLSTVLSDGKEVWLKSTANLSTGGTAEDVTDTIHPANKILFERIARVIGLDICGIDVMAPDLTTPIVQNGGAIIEVNAAPGLRMHLKPTSGTPRNVAAPIVDMLFPNGANGRIPLIAITGTNGKTTTTRLVAQMVQEAGYHSGYTTTDGIYLNQELIYKGDCSGPASAQVVLRDPAVQFAVLECARGGILRSGLGFDTCDAAIVTNVAEDHLGLDGIDTIDKLARVKSVVPETVKEDGYAVLNADDDRVYAMRDAVKSKVALFSLYPDSVRIQQHCAAGGLAAVVEEGYLIIYEGLKMLVVDEVKNIPITYNGAAAFNVANALAATLAAYTCGISVSHIRNALRNFRNSVDQTPGRMNEFKFHDFTVMVDYAHNPHGLRAFGAFIKALPVKTKRGVIAGIGDRRTEDIVTLAEEAARIFDEIIIRMDDDLRGRTELEIGSLLKSGIQKVAPDKKVAYVSNELDAVDYVVQTATPQSFTVVFVDNVVGVCNRLKQHLEQQQSASQLFQKAI